MVLWFVGTSVLTIWFVFRDPAFDYRFLILGALLPDVVDAVWGGARGFHSVSMGVAILVVVMLATVGRRARRKMLLGIPIGLLLHLIYDGAFADTSVFWWPFTGVAFADARLPVVERGLFNVVLEAIGASLCVVIWRRFHLGERDRRRRFVTSGQLAE